MHWTRTASWPNQAGPSCCWGADGAEQGLLKGWGVHIGLAQKGLPEKPGGIKASTPRQHPGRTRAVATPADAWAGASGHALGNLLNQPPSTGGSSRRSAHLRGRTRAQSALCGPT